MSPAEPHWLLLRFRDLDAFGHVYHAVYLTLLDEARTHWLGHDLSFEDPSGYVVARLEIDYVSSLRAEDAAVRVEVALERVGRTSLTLLETTRASDDRVVARSRTVVVLRDPATGAPRPLTGAEQQAAERYRVAAAPPPDART